MKFGNLFQDKINRRSLKDTDQVVFIGMQDVCENATIKNLTKLNYSDVKTGLTYFEKNDVLVAKITPCFENGKGGFADSIPTQIGFGSTEFHILRAKENVDSRYVYFQTKRQRFRNELEGEMVGSAGHRRVPFASIQKFELEVEHSLEEQTSIANALSDVDALITTLEQLIGKKRAIKTAAMQQLLTGKKRLPPFDQTHTGYKQTELGEIPEDWELISFGEISSIDPENLGAFTDAEYEFDYISLEQVERGVLSGTTKVNYLNAPSRARRVVRKGDVLVSTVRPNLMSHYVQKVECQDLVCSTGFSVLRPKDTVCDSSFLFFHLFANAVNTQIDMLISGSNYPAINSGDVKGLKIPTPSIEEQVEISKILSDMDENAAALCELLNKTQQLKQGGMQELLTGRTRLL